MDQLKVELLKLGKEQGDSGSTEVQTKWIDSFLSALQQSLTPGALTTFHAKELRALYVIWMTQYLKDRDLEACNASLVWHLDLTYTPREARALPPAADNLVSIFKRKS